MGLYADDKKERYQMAELQHGRLAMIAIGGMIQRDRGVSFRKNAFATRATPRSGSFVTGCGVFGSTN